MKVIQKLTLASAVFAAIALSACGAKKEEAKPAAAAPAAAVTTPASGGKFVLISHAPDSDSWWNTIKNSVKEAGDDFGVQVDYRNPPNGDLADMARLVDGAAAKGYDGVSMSIADINVLKGPVANLVAKNIPVVTINSGTTEQSESLKALMHVGQSEFEAGKAAGEKAKVEGVKSFLCVNHYATNPASFERCRGFAEAIGADFKASTVDSGEDPTAIESKVTAYLRKNPTTQAVLTLGPTSAHPTLRALDKAGKTGKIFFATFDLSKEIADGIKSGAIKFAIDQQPYLQGYVSIAVLALSKQLGTTDVAKITEALKANPKFQERLKTYGLAPVYGTKHISSGPGFITKDNLSLVEQYAGKTR